MVSTGNVCTIFVANVGFFVLSEDYHFPYFSFIRPSSIKKDIIKIKQHCYSLRTGKTIYGLYWTTLDSRITKHSALHIAC